MFLLWCVFSHAIFSTNLVGVYSFGRGRCLCERGGEKWTGWRSESWGKHSQVCVELWGCGMVCLERCCCVNQSKASVMQIFQMIKRNHSCPDVSVWCHRTCGICKSLEEGLNAETFTSTSCVPLALEQKRGCHGNVDFKVFSSTLLKSVHYPIWMILGC